MGKHLSISLKLKFTPKTLGCYGLNQRSASWMSLLFLNNTLKNDAFFSFFLFVNVFFAVFIASSHGR